MKKIINQTERDCNPGIQEAEAGYLVKLCLQRRRKKQLINQKRDS